MSYYLNKYSSISPTRIYNRPKGYNLINKNIMFINFILKFSKVFKIVYYFMFYIYINS